MVLASSSASSTKTHGNALPRSASSTKTHAPVYVQLGCLYNWAEKCGFVLWTCLPQFCLNKSETWTAMMRASVSTFEFEPFSVRFKQNNVAHSNVKQQVWRCVVTSFPAPASIVDQIITRLVPGSSILREATKKRQLWKFIGWRQNSKNGSRAHGQSRYGSRNAIQKYRKLSERLNYARTPMQMPLQMMEQTNMYTYVYMFWSDTGVPKKYNILKPTFPPAPEMQCWADVGFRPVSIAKNVIRSTLYFGRVGARISLLNIRWANVGVGYKHTAVLVINTDYMRLPQNHNGFSVFFHIFHKNKWKCIVSISVSHKNTCACICVCGHI